jgi:F-type H+-transporting ATPase subunit a
MLTVQTSIVRRSWFLLAMIIALVSTGSGFLTCSPLQASPAGAGQADHAEESDSEAKPESDPVARPEAKEDGPSPRAAEIASIFGFPITNSMLVTWIVALGLIVSAQVTTRKMELVPSGLQNFWEWLVEGLYSFLEQIIGPHLVKRTFWFFATLFIFILAANWVGLIPGVGTIGWGHDSAEGFKVDTPLFRGATADLNLTLAMALVFFALWIYWVLSEVGPIGLFRELFTGPRAGMPRTLVLLLAPIFFAAGCVEVVSILLRPVALCFRLYGNIYAGDTMLETMSTRLPGFGWLLPIPFYFLELLFGFVQAMVFMLLAAVFTLLECPQSDEASTSE